MDSRQPVASIIAAPWILTLDPDFRILHHHCIVIDKGRILALLPQTQTRFRAQDHIHLPRHVLMPGLVNAHGHAAMSLFRGLADDLPLMTWLNDHIWPAEKRWVSEAFVRDGALLAMAEMIRSGTTCFSDMYFFPNVVARTACEVQMRAQVAFPILDFPSAWATDADDYLRKGLQLHDDFRNQELIQVAFGPHAPYTVSDAPLRKVAALAAETNRPIQMHIHETAFEVEDAALNTGKRPLHRLHELHLLGPQMQAVHMTQLNDYEIALLAQTGTHVVHCPESNLKLASGFCPVAKLLEAGVNVALGSDGAASNNDLDLFGEMRTAALLAKGVAQNPAAVPARQALAMATLNGARALGIDHLTGSLEAGKSADLIALKLDAPPLHPLHHLTSQLVYSASAAQVTDNWVAGRRLLHDGRLTTIDLPALLERVSDWQQQIAQQEPHP